MSNLKKCRVEGCGVEFEDYKQGNICKSCRRINYQAYQERKRLNRVPNTDDFRQPYPYTEKETFKRFSRVKKELKGCKERSDWQEYLTNKLNELFEDKPLLRWIFERVDKTLDKLIIGEDEVVVSDKPKQLGRPPIDIRSNHISNADAWKKIENEIDKASTKKL